MLARTRPRYSLLILLTASVLVGCVRISSSPEQGLPTLIPTAVPLTTLPTPTVPSSPATPSAPSPQPTATAGQPTVEPTADPLTQPTSSPTTQPTLPPSETPTAEPTLNPLPPSPTIAAGPTLVNIGTSYEGRLLTSYEFGNGPDHIVFIGGIHGGYEWNTILLAYEAIDYFTANPGGVPASVTLHIIPSANPDGQVRVTGTDGRFSPQDVDPDSFLGRFNANNVDLNRNWDCNWVSTAFWRDQIISAGDQVFSEPEVRALRDFLVGLRPIAVVFWHSAANGVYAAGCPDLYQASFDLATIYGQAAGYPIFPTFDLYQVTGDAGDWLALQDIPSVSVELINHQATQWQQNLNGMLAVLDQYPQIQRSQNP